MGKITFILGGARSGKSAYALALAKKYRGKVAFIATCQPLDSEMKSRIKLHQKSRPLNWQTFEEYRDIDRAIGKIDAKSECVVIDCLTLLVSNLILAGYPQAKVEERIKRMLARLAKIKAEAIIVSNEVGLGIVPQNKLGRDFRDVAGRVNQVVAKESDKVFLLVSGIPVKIKTKGGDK